MSDLGLVQWGDVGTWAGAVFTGLVFLVALWLLVLQRRDIKQLQSEKRSEQARMVTAWASSLHVAVLSVGYQNQSPEAVYDVVVKIPDDRERGAFISHRLGIVPPGTKSVANITLPLQPAYNVKAENIPVSMSFRDSAGRPWTRNPFGVLSEFAPLAEVEPEAGVPSALDFSREDPE